MQRIEMPFVLRGHLAKELHRFISRRTPAIQNIVFDQRRTGVYKVGSQILPKEFPRIQR